MINICKYFWDATGLPRFSSTLVNKRALGIKRPFPNAFIGAGMVFGRAQWIVDCPFDHYLQYLFSGEELLLSVCLFTKGWNVYNPDVLPVWHWYKRDIAGRENPQVDALRDKLSIFICLFCDSELEGKKERFCVSNFCWD